MKVAPCTTRTQRRQIPKTRTSCSSRLATSQPTMAVPVLARRCRALLALALQALPPPRLALLAAVAAGVAKVCLEVDRRVVGSMRRHQVLRSQRPGVLGTAMEGVKATHEQVIPPVTCPTLAMVLVLVLVVLVMKGATRQPKRRIPGQNAMQRKRADGK